ncbi:MAG: transposase [Candidatus Yonathbacteria bacterium]|nr:transposase [Candidatus Yonathbacteria bacterium]
MQRKIIFSIGEYYHLYSRGTDKRIIFVGHHDYQRFKALLYVCNSTNPVNITKHFREGRTFEELYEIEREDTLVDIGVYCPMPNHFHLLVREKRDGGITKFIQKLLTAYSMYFNKKNNRTGSLFESEFKAKHIDSDEYLKYNFAYHHLNPIKLIDSKWKENGIANREVAKEFLTKYVYSSYLDYQGVDRPESNILNPDAFPEYFTNVKDFNVFIDEWLSFGDTE